MVHGWPVSPQYGAVAAAVVSAIIIGLVSLRAREREDTIIGAVWAIGMAVGILFIAVTPGYHEDLMSYLFGNILLIGGSDLWMMAALDAVVLVLGLGLYPQLEAVCFDEEFARLRGLRVEFYVLLLLVLIALTVVLLVSVVGIVLVIALLTLPAAIAGHFTTTLRGMMAVAAILAVDLHHQRTGRELLPRPARRRHHHRHCRNCLSRGAHLASGRLGHAEIAQPFSAFKKAILGGDHNKNLTTIYTAGSDRVRP